DPRVERGAGADDYRDRLRGRPRARRVPPREPRRPARPPLARGERSCHPRGRSRDDRPRRPESELTMFGLDDWIASFSDGATLAVVAAVAVVLGLRHATDPDHLAAVSALIAGAPARAARA